MNSMVYIRFADASEKIVLQPKRPSDEPFHGGNGSDVITCRTIVPDVDVRSYSSDVKREILSVEILDKTAMEAVRDDNVGVKVICLTKDNMTHVDDV